MKALKELLVCPHCQGALSARTDAYLCTSCAREFALEEGIPNFCTQETYWGEFEEELATQLVQESQRHGWQRAIEKVLQARPDLVEYLLDLRRANALFLVPERQRGILLDVGSGWGTMAQMASQLFEQVVALEPVNLRARFAQQRFTQLGAANIMSLRASLTLLPFAPESFDVVLMNGILEWVGEWTTGKSPRALQIRTLQTMHALLKPGGLLLVGIENRFGYNFFLGRRDHNGLWGTNLMPRLFARLTSRLWLGKDYRVYTHSYGALTKLMRSAGFDRIQLCAPLPGYNKPFQIISLPSPHAFNYYLDQLSEPGGVKNSLKRGTAKMLTSVGIMKYLVPDFLVLAKKHE